MLKRLGALLAVLIALCLIIAYFFHENAAPKASEPLAQIGASITGIAISNPSAGESVVLQKGGGVWTMISPAQDAADQETCAELIKDLSGLSIGTAVAENPASYPQYDIQDASATRVTLSAGSPPKTVFDAYFGKTALGFNSLYLRRPGKKEVYLAEGVSSYLISKSASDYRDRGVFRLPQTQLESAVISIGRADYKVVKSSAGWAFTEPKSATKKSAIEAAQLLNDLYSLRIADFPPKKTPESRMGFSRPLMTITLGGGGEENALVVGRAAKSVIKSEPPVYDYAKVSGRAAPFYLNVYDVNALLKRLVLPKTKPRAARHYAKAAK